jgi:selenide,water dikinase
VGKVSPETIGRILAGGASVCAAAGIPVAGGHTIDSSEPIYGLVALGLVHPDQVLTNKGGREGDILILTKPLGVGVLSAALKQDRLDLAGYETLIATTTQLNVLGRDLAGMAGVHAVTDVTGFGLLGHALEMAQGAQLLADIEVARVPLLPGVEAMVRSGIRTGASTRNWESYQDLVQEMVQAPHWRRDLLTDPQTSGGLLIAVAPAAAEAVLAQARARGFHQAVAIGRLVGRSMGIKPRVRLH